MQWRADERSPRHVLLHLRNQCLTNTHRLKRRCPAGVRGDICLRWATTYLDMRLLVAQESSADAIANVG